jgi:prepilin-type N-terminal cleavage/methylation domain-containing protein
MTKPKNQSKREMNPKQMNMKKLKKGERGFSLVELVIVVALAGLVGAAITATAFQVFTFSTRLSNQMTAVRQVQQAGFWVSPDVMMSNRTKINVNPGGGKFLVLDWTAHDGKEHEVTYTITVDDRLQRTHNITVGGQTTMEVSIIAEYINSTQTSCVKVGGALNFTVVFNVTATVGGQTETRIYQVKPRQGT